MFCCAHTYFSYACRSLSVSVSALILSNHRSVSSTVYHVSISMVINAISVHRASLLYRSVEVQCDESSGTR